MRIKLTPEQRRMFETVLWLTDPIGEKGSGRTHLLALAYIQHSIKYKTWVPIMNHGLEHPQANKELLDRIRGIVGNMKDYNVKINNHSRQPRILIESIPKEPYTDNFYKKE